MILPSKFLPAERSLIVVGGEVLNVIKDSPKSVSEVWEHVRGDRNKRGLTLGFDWFTLALTFLYTVHMIDMKDGLLTIQRARGQ
ncbi:hypothetical protein ELI54_08300 [Rhizobium ruizarguesonis]|mgnify:CR=1 FL=1|uniref:ABC-three component system middle component 6 n=1 Tax=Rhizobium TaxID=379 RepID=UPI0002EE15B9|nr:MULTISPECIES: ABC-three component system middle component 6 [Rhizobium]MBY3249902.1 hypothetical protein [Rhizobium laguerreae]MBY3531054.1 hypothetical protein [Rhizobium laguerreae]NEI92358.1 hypothetical protein [Rhizobium leguminosarum]NEJ79114.1 hypothetical protein [Rhizobium leguminosarum]TAT88210.1 hypothetical protein ELI54_08300 [Rhizobium ruizarguesonis]